MKWNNIGRDVIGILLIVWAAAPCLRIPCSACTKQLNSWKGLSQFLLQFSWNVVVQRPSFHGFLPWATSMTRRPWQHVHLKYQLVTLFLLICAFLLSWKHAKTPREESWVQMQLAHPPETVALSEDLKSISSDILQSCQTREECDLPKVTITPH